MVREYSWPFSREMDSSVLPGLPRGLCSYCRVSYHLTAPLTEFIWTLVCLQVLLFYKGSPKLSEGLICDCERCPGKFSLCLMFPSFHDKEGLKNISPPSL